MLEACVSLSVIIQRFKSNFGEVLNLWTNSRCLEVLFPELKNLEARYRWTDPIVSGIIREYFIMRSTKHKFIAHFPW